MCNSWISAATWRLIIVRVFVNQDHNRDQRQLYGLGRKIWASLQEDRHCRVELSGMAVEYLLASDLHLMKEV